MKTYIYILLAIIGLIAFTSCESDEIDTQGKEIYDLDVIKAEIAKKLGCDPSEVDGGYEPFWKPNDFVFSVFGSINHQTIFSCFLKDKDGKNLLSQVDKDKIRIYIVKDGKEVLQQIDAPVDDGTPRSFQDGPYVGSDYSEYLKWIKKYYPIAKYYGVRSDIDNPDEVVSLEFFRTVASDQIKYVIRWNDKWSDTIEIKYHWILVRSGGKLGYLPHRFTKIWINGEPVFDITEEQVMSDKVNMLIPDELTFVH